MKCLLPRRLTLSEGLKSQVPNSAVAYIVSPMAVTKVEEVDVTVVLELAVEVVEVGVLVLLVLVLEEEDKDMYRGWD